MLDILRTELEKEHVFQGQLPSILQDLANSIDNYRIPARMKYLIAVSEFILFFSQFQKKIVLPDGAKIPINSISFCISPSGTGKDSSKDAVRACFGVAYQAINNKRKENAKRRAIEAARQEQEENPTAFEVYKKYYVAPNPLFSSPDSTIEGLTSDFNRLEEEKLGAGFLYTGEIGDEMGKGIAELMTFMAEIYDKGSKEVKALKGKDSQLKPIENLPVSALFMGSPAAILESHYVIDYFKKAFNSKLARRSFFVYAPEEIQKPTFSNIDEIDAWIANNKSESVKAKQRAIAQINDAAEVLLADFTNTLEVSTDVERIYNRYMLYNEELSEHYEHSFPISKLVRKHLQWKALKFAGAIAMFNKHKQIEKSDYIAAISFCETLEHDMKAFETELSKQNHEIFVDLMHKLAGHSGESNISIHDIKKLGYIPGNSNTQQKIKELVELAASYDKTGIYTICEEGVCYEQQIITSDITVSYIAVDNSEIFKLIENNAGKEAIDLAKHNVAATTVYGYNEMTTTFEDLGAMLLEDFAYTPFKLRQAGVDAIYDKDKHHNATKGVRGKNNVVGGCKWIVLDVDQSTLSAKEVHFMLSEFNHHIALTSDKSNMYKFRVLIELDSIVDIPDIQWKHFIQLIAEFLAIKADPLPKAQIFFSYSGREVLSVVDADPLPAKEYIIKSAEMVAKKERPQKLSTAQSKLQLNDPMGTFWYAYEAEQGGRSRSLIRAAYHAKDLNASTQEIIDLMYDINDYWSYPLEKERFERTIITPISRWS